MFATPALARQYVRQDWDRWPVDAVLPMMYHHYYGQPAAWVAQAVREGVAALPATVPLHAGLFVPRLEPAELATTATQALAAGAAGVALFSHAAMTPAHWTEVAAALL